MTRSVFRLVAAAALSVTLGCAGGAADKIRTLDGQALQDYEGNRPQEARKKLVEALAVAKENGLDNAEETARTRLYLGVVYVGALKQREKGIEQMALALQAHPQLKLPASVAGKAKVKKAYATAKMKALMRQTGDEVVAGDAPAPAAPAESASTPSPASPGASATPSEVAATPAPPAAARSRDPKPAESKAAAPVEPPPKVAAVVAAESEADDEPDLPATLPAPVYCPLPDEVPPEQQVAVWCVIRGDVGAKTARLYFRQRGQEQFSLAAMNKTKKGWYAGEIPAAAVSGKTVQYYVEAVGTGNKVMAATGDFSSPNLLLLRPGARPAKRENLLMALSTKDDAPEKTTEDENPLAVQDAEVSAAGEGSGAPGPWWIAVGVGTTGYGWHGSGDLEYRRELSVESGFAGTSPQLLGEVGFRLNDRNSLSLQARYQVISSEGTNEGRTGRSARGAISGLIRWTYLLRDGGYIRPFVSGAIGGGEGFRLVINPNKVAGQGGTDTVRGGPVVIGPGAGLSFRLGSRTSVLMEARTLIGAPDLAAVIEGNMGVQVAF